MLFMIFFQAIKKSDSFSVNFENMGSRDKCLCISAVSAEYKALPKLLCCSKSWLPHLQGKTPNCLLRELG